MDLLNLIQKQQERLERIEQLLATQKNVLNLEEVSLLTGLSKSHLYKLTCYNKIPFYKQAKHLYFDRSEIENWLKANPSKTVEQMEDELANSLNIKKKGVGYE